MNEVLAQLSNPAVAGAIFVGIVAGMVAGALPGLTATMAVALLVPYTFGWHSDIAGLMILLGVYVGTMYGGAVPAVLIHTPGTPAAAATCFDGYPLSRQGKAGLALGISCITSVVGGLFSAGVLILVGPMIAEQALKISPADYFAITILGLSVIAGVAGKSLLKGLIMGAVGVLAATVGQDPAQAHPRFTFGSDYLLDGLSFIPVMIGVFAVAEALHQVSEMWRGSRVVQAIGRVLPTWQELKQIAPATMLANVIGTVVGAIPGAGGDIASFVSYDQAKRVSREPEKFGEGSLEGLAAAECANNSITGGAMIPMLTLGIPGDSVTAILLAAMYVHNLRPGPLLFSQHADKVGAIFAGLVIANLVVLPLGLLGAKPLARIVSIPRHILWPLVVVLCVVGSYALNNSFFDVWLTLGAGVFGYAMKRLGFPPGPLVLGLILGPLAEEKLTTALQISRGQVSVLWDSPLSIVIYAVTALLLVATALGRRERRDAKQEGASE